MSKINAGTVEAQLIGALLAHPDNFHRCLGLSSESFTDPTYRTIWEAISDCHSAGVSPSSAVVAIRHPKKMDPLGGVDFLNRLAAHGEDILPAFGEAVDRLQEDHQWRRLQTINARLATAVGAKEMSANDVLSGLIKIATQHLASSRGTTETKLSVARRAVQNAIAHRDVVTTGLECLDTMMQGGIQTERLYGISGQFGIGKTILLGTISDNFNMQGIPHLFLSLETDPTDIEMRNCAKHLNLNVAALHDKGDPDHAQFVQHADTYLAKAPDNVHYDFAPMASIDEIHRKILAAKAEHGIKGFIIDYWQLIRGKQRGSSEMGHLKEVSDRLAAICRQEGLWGLVTAQCDERGRLKVSDALQESCALLLRLVREQGQQSAYFETYKSNYTRFFQAGNESYSTLFFDDEVGPHFRNVDPTDIDELTKDGGHISI